MLTRLFRFLSIFPLSTLHIIGALFGQIIYWSSGTYRRRLQSNIAQAGFSSLQDSAVLEAGKSVLELPFIWYARPERFSKHLILDNWQVVQTALDLKRGIIFLTPHLGGFELIGKSIALHTPITCLYRPPRKAALKPLLEGARIESGIKLAPANLSGVRILLKALKKGETVGILPDQVPQQGEGVWADFFGKPAYTMTLSAKLHAMTGAPIILTYAERLPKGAGFIQHFSSFEDELTGDAAQQARIINHAMEKMIAKAPDQYFWSYQRYKRPAGVSGPDDKKQELAQEQTQEKSEDLA
jgi:KDO2-lipid IV(A) lauroyltransferase